MFLSKISTIVPYDGLRLNILVHYRKLVNEFLLHVEPEAVAKRKCGRFNGGISGQQTLWSIGRLTSTISGEGSGYGCILELIHIPANLHGSRSGGVIGTLVY